MKLIKKSRWLKTFLAAILIISMASQSLTAYAQSKGSLGGTPAGTQGSDKVETVSGNTYSAYGWVISIQEVVNTATNVAAGSTESEVSFDNAWLYDFPECYYATTGNSLYSNPEKYAFIRYGSSVSGKYSVANPEGGNSYTDRLVTSYASGKGSGNFSTEAKLLENSSYYETILTGIKSYSLTSEYVIYAANSTGNLQSAINSFVKLWQDSGSVDDAINSFVFDTDDYWDQVIRYLDLLIIVNAMCNNAWNDYIQYYLENLNQDGSEKFVAIVVAAAVNYTTAQGGEQALMTLPVYYARRTGSTITSYISWDGAGGDWDSVRDTFNSYPTNSRTGYHMEGTSPDNNTQKIWWNEGVSGSAHMATTVYPVGSDGSLGFCGYTYIAPTLVPDPDDIIKPTDSSNPSPSPSSSVAATDVVTPTFTVEVTTENEYMQRDKTQPVTATVTIDMGQTDAVQKTFKSIYTSLKNSDESYKTAIEVFVERTFSDSSGVDTSNAVMDSDASGGYFASAVQPTRTSAVVYRWQGTDWDSGSNSSVTALPASPPANPRTTTTPPSRQTERSSVSPSQGRQKM